MKGNWWSCAKCKTCGKEVVINPGWAYKIQNGKSRLIFCSWPCIQEYRGKKKRKTKAKGLDV